MQADDDAEDARRHQLLKFVVEGVTSCFALKSPLKRWSFSAFYFAQAPLERCGRLPRRRRARFSERNVGASAKFVLDQITASMKIQTTALNRVLSFPRTKSSLKEKKKGGFAGRNTQKWNSAINNSAIFCGKLGTLFMSCLNDPSHLMKSFTISFI